MSGPTDDTGPLGGRRAGGPGAWLGEGDAGALSGRSSPMPPLSALAEALGADDTEERRQAASRLGGAELPEALPLLLRALGDPDWRVRKEATYACQRLIHASSPPPPIAGEGAADRPESASRILVGALIDALRSSDDVGLRNAAIEVLGHCGPDATPALIGALSELTGDERKLVVDALGRTRDPAALDALYATLSEQDDNLRHAAIEAIASMGLIARERVTEILYERLVDRDRFVRLTSLHGLNALEAPVPWRALSPLIDDPLLRPAALVAAALSESPEAPRALCAALATARGGSFAQLVRALARLVEGPLAAHAVEALRAAPPEVGARLVQAVVSALHPGPTTEPPSWRGLGPDPMSGRAEALLLAALARAPGAAEAAVQSMIEPALVETAQRALAALGAEALPAVLAYLERHVDPDPELWEGVDDATAALIDGAVAIAQQRGRDGEPEEGAPSSPWAELLEVLRRSVKSPSTLVATSALYGLAKIGTAEDLELAAAQTRAVSLPVARAAESALAGLAERYPDEARALVRRAMPREETYLAAVIVIDALGASGPEEIGFLMNAAAAGDVRARRAAVTAVAEEAGAAALDVLSLSLADEEREVRLAAARAVGRLCASLAGAPGGDAAAARARELLALVRASGEPDLVAAAAQGGATFGSDPPARAEGERPPGPAQAEGERPPGPAQAEGERPPGPAQAEGGEGGASPPVGPGGTPSGKAL